MRARSTSIFTILMKFVTWTIVFVMLICACSPFIHPKQFWFIGFMSLLFPYLFFTVLVLFFYWLFRWSTFLFLPLLSLLLSAYTFHFNFSFHTPDRFKTIKSPDALRLMSWNVRHFIPFDENNFRPASREQIKKVFNEIEQYQPDAICFQEFISLPDEKKSNPFAVLKDRYGYAYHQFDGSDIFHSNQYSGTAIFSKYPILKGGIIPFPYSNADNTEATVYADIIKDGDTIRVYSIHLQSFGFGSREYKALGRVERPIDENVGESKHLIKKMKNTFDVHGAQADFLTQILEESHYPYILAGDLNDVPGSYAYMSVRSDHLDAFLEKGSFLGSTFTSSFSFLLKSIPTLRIDYIFHPAAFSTIQYKRGGIGISDHFFLLADIALPK